MQASKKWVRFIAFLFAASAWLAAPALAQSYEMVELSESESQAYAINNYGQIVGWYEADGNHHGFHWNSGELDDVQMTSHLFTLLVFTVPYSEAYDISDADQMVGSAQYEVQCDPTIKVTAGFVLRPVPQTDFGTPVPGDAITDLGAFDQPCITPNSAATGISNNYHLVGWADWGWPYWGRGGPHHAFIVTPQNGKYYEDLNGDAVNDYMIDLGSLGGPDSTSAAADVNDNGVVVGHAYADGASAAYHAFLWAQGATDGHPSNPQMKDLGTLGGTNSRARDINNLNLVVGESDTANFTSHAFLWAEGSITSLGTLGGNHSSAAAINDAGQVVGWAETPGGIKHAFLWHNGLMQDLNDLLPSGTALTLTEARDINERGEIVGWGADKQSGVTRAFLLRAPTDIGDTTPDDSGPTDPDDQSNTGTGTGTGTSTSPAPDPLLSPTAEENDGTQVADEQVTADVCGAGLLAVLPLTVLGLTWIKTDLRRRRC